MGLMAGLAAHEDWPGDALCAGEEGDNDGESVMNGVLAGRMARCIGDLAASARALKTRSHACACESGAGVYVNCVPLGSAAFCPDNFCGQGQEAIVPVRRLQPFVSRMSA